MSEISKENQQKYWKENLGIIIVHLAIWFFVSFFCGIMVVDQLDQYMIGGFPVGFWFANQGSMIIFVVLIWTYVWMMNNLDKKYDVHEG